MDRRILPDTFPFAERSANMMNAAELNNSYQRLFELPGTTFADSEYQYVWRYEDVSEVLQARTNGLTVAHTLVPRVGFGALALYPGNWLPFARDLVPLPAHATADNTDPVSHARIWKAMASARTGWLTNHSSPAFMDRHFEAALARQMGTENNGEVYIDVSDLAVDYAAHLVAEMVGVPKEQWPNIKHWSRAQSGLLGQRVPRSEQPQAIGSLGRLFRLGKQLVNAAAEHTNTDTQEGTFINHLLDEGVRPSHAVSVFANSVAAGVFTIGGSLQLSVEGLLDTANLEHWHSLSDRPQVTPITNEALRLYPGLVAWPRYATEEVILKSGTLLQKGPILALTGAANRDPSVIDTPDEFRPHRQIGARVSSLTFGKGAHQCPGQDPSRRAVAAFLSGLYAAAPDAELIEHPDAHKPVAQDRLFNGAQVILRAPRRQAL